MKSNQKVAKNRKSYSCEMCNYNTSNHYDFEKHNLTRKHLANIKSNQIEQESPQKSQHHICKNCNKQYNSKSGLWNHSKKCSQNNDKLENTIISRDPNVSDLLMEIIKQNQEFKEHLMEIVKEPRMVNHGTVNNTNNTQFNLQLFLNEKCKDAITANEFVENLQISFADLENLGNKGYVEGITNIILKGLKMLDVTKRTFHCTDVKRETMYIKDINEWTKDNEDKTKLKSVIENVATKNKYKAKEWRETHPGIHVLDSRDNNMHMKLFEELMAIEAEKEEKLKEKIIKNLAKEVHVDK